MKAPLPLTRKLQETKDFIASYIERERTSPTYAEIADALGLASSSCAHQRVKGLIWRGHAIRGGQGEARTLRLISDICPHCGHQSSESEQAGTP